MSTTTGTRSPRSRVLFGIAATTAVVASSLALSATTAAAGNDKGPKVPICHATSSATNPFTVNTVDTSSIANLVEHNGHGLHSDDIIPPFVDRRGDQYPGLNWDTGSSIWNGGLCDGEGGGTTG